MQVPSHRGPLIGMMGKKRAGKDTFASALVSDLGFTRIAFADPLRETIYELNPWLEPTPIPGNIAPYRCIRLRDYIDALGWHVAKDNLEVRRLLQAHGVAMRNNVDPDVWVNAAMRQASPILDRGEGVVITDVRFPNEAFAVKSAGGVLVRITRDSGDFQGEADNHISETALDGWTVDLEIENNGTVAELFKRAHNLWISLEAGTMAE